MYHTQHVIFISALMRITFQSDANINVSDGPASDPRDSLITVTGTLNSVEKAFSSIVATVCKVSKKTIFER